jgi:hypothetical protein
MIRLALSTVQLPESVKKEYRVITFYYGTGGRDSYNITSTTEEHSPMDCSICKATLKETEFKFENGVTVELLLTCAYTTLRLLGKRIADGEAKVVS